MRGEGQSDGRPGSGVCKVETLVVATVRCVSTLMLAVRMMRLDVRNVPPAVVVGAAREDAREREHDC